MCGTVVLTLWIVWNFVWLWNGSRRSNSSPQMFEEFCYMTMKLFRVKIPALEKNRKMWYNCVRLLGESKNENFSNYTKYKFGAIRSTAHPGKG